MQKTPRSCAPGGDLASMEWPAVAARPALRPDEPATGKLFGACGGSLLIAVGILGAPAGRPFIPEEAIAA
jgi:hypothetical protein